MGCETRIFDPSDLPLTDQIDYDDHPAIHELREHALWSEGMVWSSAERHGQISGIMKLQIDHLPLSMGGMRPTQGRTLAVMQVSSGSQSFNAINTLRLLGRWMRMIIHSTTLHVERLQKGEMAHVNYRALAPCQGDGPRKHTSP